MHKIFKVFGSSLLVATITANIQLVSYKAEEYVKVNQKQAT